MEQNPYESPASPIAAPTKPLPWQQFLKVTTCACWFAGLIWAALGVVAMFLTTESLLRGTPGAFMFYGMWVVVFALPISGLALVGAGCWRRSGRLVIFGLAPIISAVTIFAVFVMDK